MRVASLEVASLRVRGASGSVPAVVVLRVATLRVGCPGGASGPVLGVAALRVATFRVGSLGGASGPVARHQLARR
jgi:hypothetical protein